MCVLIAHDRLYMYDLPASFTPEAPTPVVDCPSVDGAVNAHTHRPKPRVALRSS